MKRVVSHTRQCKRKSNGGCPICKQLIALCCYHAKVCQEAKCPVHFCQNIKQKLRQQQLQQRLQEAAMMRRRMAQMNARMNMNQNHNNDSQPQKPVSSVPAIQQQVQQRQGPPQPQQQQPQQGPPQQPNPQQMKPVMPGVHGKPGTGAQPGPGVLEAVKKVQEEAQRQQQSFGKGNPQGVGMPGGPVASSANSTGMMIQQPQHQQGPMMQTGNPQQQQWQQQTRFNMPGPQQQQQRMPMPQQQQQQGQAGSQLGKSGVGQKGGEQPDTTMQSLQLFSTLHNSNSKQLWTF